MTAMLSCQTQEADLLVYNATIYTVDERFSVADCMVIRDGKIVAVGTKSELNRIYRAKKTVDLGGNFIFPGFNDAHAHFYGYGINLLRRADLAASASREEIVQRLHHHYSTFGGAWIEGRGWDQNHWLEKVFPNKSILDEHFPDVPVFLIRIDGHAAWCNSKALQLAGITAKTSIEGGQVMLENGEPSGILIDAAMELVSRLIPEDNLDRKALALQAAQQNCFAAGLTSVTDCGLPKEIVLLIDSLQRSDLLSIRINAMLDPTEENFDHFVKKGRYQTDRLMVNTIKLYADGALGSRGALMLEPYSDDAGNMGLQMASKQYYETVCQLAYNHGYQMATHCIGDSANRLMLQVYGKFLKETNDLRWRIEHAQIVHPDDFELFRRYSIVPSIQATHATSDMYWAKDRVGERLQGGYAYQKLLGKLGWLPNGTDFPVEAIYPLHTFYASVFRTDHAGYPAGGFQTENALSREQSLRSMTIWAARSSFEESVKGSLEPGKWADFVVLDSDLMVAEPSEILQASILATWVGGLEVFRK